MAVFRQSRCFLSSEISRYLDRPDDFFPALTEILRYLDSPCDVSALIQASLLFFPNSEGLTAMPSPKRLSMPLPLTPSLQGCQSSDSRNCSQAPTPTPTPTPLSLLLFVSFFYFFLFFGNPSNIDNGQLCWLWTNLEEGEDLAVFRQ